MIKNRKIIGIIIFFLKIICVVCFLNIPVRGVSVDKYAIYNSWFNDIENHWAKQYIVKLLDYGIINGYDNNTFRPDASVSRVETVIIFSKALGLKSTSDITYIFNDEADIPVWAKGFVQTAINNNIIKGTQENYFLPNNKIIRTEVAVILTNSFNILPTSTQLQYFSDSLNIPTWAVGHVNGVFNAGIISGYQDGTFGPRKFMTRAELCVIISKSIDKFLLKQ